MAEQIVTLNAGVFAWKTLTNYFVAMRYVINGSEGDDFSVSFGAGIMADNNYAPGGWVENSDTIVAMKFPNGAGDRTATAFRVQLSSPDLAVGDTLIFHLVHF